jgi:hypothetical protein
MNVTSAVRDSRVTLPIMPKAPASVNVAALNAASAMLSSSPRKRGPSGVGTKDTGFPLSYQNERE